MLYISEGKNPLWIGSHSRLVAWAIPVGQFITKTARRGCAGEIGASRLLASLLGHTRAPAGQQDGGRFPLGWEQSLYKPFGPSQIRGGDKQPRSNKKLLFSVPLGPYAPGDAAILHVDRYDMAPGGAAPPRP